VALKRARIQFAIVKILIKFSQNIIDFLKNIVKLCFVLLKFELGIGAYMQLREQK
jgi:hypothetical protein